MKSSSLQGKRILVTRAAHQSGEVESSLREKGAVPILFPCLEFRPLDENIRRHIAELRPGDDIAFTSSNGVEHVAGASTTELSAAFAGHRIAVVGNRTASSLRQFGVEPHIIPETASQKGLIDAYARHGLPKRLVFFRAEEGSSELSDFLVSHGCTVITVPTYQAACPTDDASAVIAMLSRREVDAVLLGSGKSAAHYLRRIGDPDLANRPVIAVISPQVARQAGDIGLKVQVIAKAASFGDMISDLAAYFAQGRN